MAAPGPYTKKLKKLNKKPIPKPTAPQQCGAFFLHVYFMAGAKGGPVIVQNDSGKKSNFAA